MIGSFIVGAIAGGALIWYYGGRMRDYLDETGRDARSRAQDRGREVVEYLDDKTRAARTRAAEVLRQTAERLETPTRPGDQR